MICSDTVSGSASDSNQDSLSPLRAICDYSYDYWPKVAASSGILNLRLKLLEQKKKMDLK